MFYWSTILHFLRLTSQFPFFLIRSWDSTDHFLFGGGISNGSCNSDIRPPAFLVKIVRWSLLPVWPSFVIERVGLGGVLLVNTPDCAKFSGSAPQRHQMGERTPFCSVVNRTDGAWSIAEGGYPQFNSTWRRPG